MRWRRWGHGRRTSSALVPAPRGTVAVFKKRWCGSSTRRRARARQADRVVLLRARGGVGWRCRRGCRCSGAGRSWPCRRRTRPHGVRRDRQDPVSAREAGRAHGPQGGRGGHRKGRSSGEDADALDVRAGLRVDAGVTIPSSGVIVGQNGPGAGGIGALNLRCRRWRRYGAGAQPGWHESKPVSMPRGGWRASTGGGCPAVLLAARNALPCPVAPVVSRSASAPR